MKVLCKDFRNYFQDAAKSFTSQIESGAAELGRPAKYLISASIKKEDEAKSFLQSAPAREGLICVLKTSESCRRAQFCGNASSLFS